ncbi:MAG: flagellar type III secretion system pore protein FliP [Gemmatirosa sp.]
MSLSATIGVFVALGAVLTLLLVSLRVLKRFAPNAGAGRGRLPMEVVQRLPLGPKQSIAVVRVGDRVLAVSVGEGGMQPLAELEGDDRAAVLAASVAPTPFASSPTALRGVATAMAMVQHPELQAIPGAAWLARRLAPARPTAESTQAEPTFAPPVVQTPAAPAAPAAPAPDAFRAVLGMAMSGSTRLAGLLLVAGALAFGAPAAQAQAPTDSQPAVPAVAAPIVAPAQAAAPQPAARGTATQTRAPRPPAARRGNTAAPTNGFATAAPSATAPTNAVGTVDTLVARLAPTMDLRMGGKGEGLRLSGTVGVVVMMGLLTLLPTMVLMMTGFTRILVVLHFLKQALGTQSAPPGHLIGALALLLTGFVMAPTMTEVNRVALQPWMEGRIEQAEMMSRGTAPLREFMLRQTRERDLQTFVEMSRPAVPPKSVDEIPLVVVMSAFVTSELRTAFQLGFALFLPFIVIDVVVSSVLMSMGMMMLPPAMIALPFKLLLFVLVDGWSLVIQSLVQSFR